MINKVIVAGAPATGKSSLINIWSTYLLEKGLTVRIIDDAQVLVNLCPKDSDSDEYHYDNTGSLVLENKYRVVIMERQYKKLRELWMEKFEGITVLEISNPNLENAIREFFEIEADSALIVVKSTKKNLYDRNELRTSWKKIPEVFLGMFDENSNLSEEKSKKLFRVSRSIENNSTFVDFENNCKRLALELFRE